MDNNTKNGRINWASRETIGTQQYSHADVTVFRAPFTLNPEVYVRLAGMTPDASHLELRKLMWRAVVSLNRSGGIPGSSYGGRSHSIESFDYVPGAPCGHVVVASSTGIGE